MTNLEALVSISQMVLRQRGEWCVEGIDEALRRDIRATVFDAEKLLRPDFEYNREKLVHDAMAELERRATLAVVS